MNLKSGAANRQWGEWNQGCRTFTVKCWNFIIVRSIIKINFNNYSSIFVKNGSTDLSGVHPCVLNNSCLDLFLE